MDIKITGYWELYSKNIAGRGVAWLIIWLGTVGLLDYFNKVFDCYIRAYPSLSIFIDRVQPTFGWPTLGYAPKMRHSTNLQEFSLLAYHTHQLEYSKQYSMIESYYRFVFSSAHYPLPCTHEANLLKVLTKNTMVKCTWVASTYHIRRNKLAQNAQ